MSHANWDKNIPSTPCLLQLKPDGSDRCIPSLCVEKIGQWRQINQRVKLDVCSLRESERKTDKEEQNKKCGRLK